MFNSRPAKHEQTVRLPRGRATFTIHDVGKFGNYWSGRIWWSGRWTTVYKGDSSLEWWLRETGCGHNGEH